MVVLGGGRAGEQGRTFYLAVFVGSRRGLHVYLGVES